MILDVFGYRSVPLLPGFTRYFGQAITLVFPLILIGSSMFMVRGYSVDGSTLVVKRLCFSTRISLDGLRRIFADPAVCKGSLRVFGNAGLFSFTGLYESKTLGRYRVFATDLSHSVVMITVNGTVVITPESPDAFIEHIQLMFPNVQIGLESQNS